MKSGYTLQGSESLKRKLNEAGRIGRTAKRRALSKAGKFAVQVFKWVAPVDTGATKKAIGITRLGSAAGNDGIFVGVRKNEKYLLVPKKLKKGAFRHVLKSARKNYVVGALEKHPVKYAVYPEA